MLTYEEMQYFSAFAECGTLTQVAERFCISQPTITRAMKKAEDVFGVPLFDRTKNRISLNDCGRMAANEVTLLLKQTDDAIARVKAYDRATRTISIGSAAAVELPVLVHSLSTSYPDKAISTELAKPGRLLAGLEDGTYQLIIMPWDPAADDDAGGTSKYYTKKIEEEHLLFLLPDDHPYADRDELSLADMNGENFLLYSEIGFWEDIVRRKMPDSRFLMQNERYSFDELITNSVLPCFSSSLVAENQPHIKSRVYIPITDPEVNVTYYLVCRSSAKKEYSMVFRGLGRRQ
jgi:DNA-binding transcriptional LysR family regulator